MNIESYFKVLTKDDIEQRELMVKKAVIYEQRLTEQVNIHICHMMMMMMMMMIKLPCYE